MQWSILVGYVTMSHRIILDTALKCFYSSNTLPSNRILMSVLDICTPWMSSHCLCLSPPEETLLQCTDLASCIRLLKPEHLNTGLELIRRIQERLVAILQHSTQVGTREGFTHSEEHSTKCGGNTYWVLCGPTASHEGFLLSGLSKHRTFEWATTPKQDRNRNLLKLQISLRPQMPIKREYRTFWDVDLHITTWI